MNIWPRVGMSIAIVAGFCIAVTELFQSAASYELWKWETCGGLIGVGVVLFIVGRIMNRRMRRAHETRAKADGQAAVEFEGPVLFGDLAFWGVGFVFCGISLIFITPMHRHLHAHAPSTAAKARSLPTNAVISNPVEPAHFPPLVLQGITYRAIDSSVLINGKTLLIGDRIAGATLVKITRTSATLELDGQAKVLVIER